MDTLPQTVQVDPMIEEHVLLARQSYASLRDTPLFNNFPQQKADILGLVEYMLDYSAGILEQELISPDPTLRMWKVEERGRYVSVWNVGIDYQAMQSIFDDIYLEVSTMFVAYERIAHHVQEVLNSKQRDSRVCAQVHDKITSTIICGLDAILIKRLIERPDFMPELTRIRRSQEIAHLVHDAVNEWMAPFSEYHRSFDEVTPGSIHAAHCAQRIHQAQIRSELGMN